MPANLYFHCDLQVFFAGWRGSYAFGSRRMGEGRGWGCFEKSSTWQLDTCRWAGVTGKHLCRVSSTTLPLTPVFYPHCRRPWDSRRGRTSASATSNLRGWGGLAPYVDAWDQGDGPCRVLIGMQRLPHDDLRDALSLVNRPSGMDNQTAHRLRVQLAEQLRPAAHYRRSHQCRRADLAATGCPASGQESRRQASSVTRCTQSSTFCFATIP